MSSGASNRSFLSDVPAEDFERAFAPAESAFEERVEQPHECESCGHKMKYADQRCGCTSKRP